MESLFKAIDVETALRVGCFAGVLLMMAVWELAAPRRHLTISKSLRWANNLGLVVFNTLALRILLPLGATATAVIAQRHGWGLLNNVSLPTWLAVMLSVIAFDLVIYVQHLLFHASPILWRLHMVHHADLDVDASTGLRFHTIEVLLSMGIKMAFVVLLGAPAVAVIIFEVLLNGTSLFNHANVRIPRWLDRVLRFVVVTPDMHRIHHSVVASETNSNFGFNLPWWDYLFRTYLSRAAADQEEMTLGLEQYREERVERLDCMLILPFVGRAGNYPVNGNRDQKVSDFAMTTPRAAAVDRPCSQRLPQPSEPLS